MIRKLMASSAIVALMTAGAFGVAQAQTEEQPAVVEQPAAAADQGAAATAEEAEQTTVVSDEATLTPNQPTIASAFMGKDVFSSEDPESDNIGEVNDLIIGEEGKITHAVVGVGGFLGIGEKDVAVPFEELQVVDREGEIRLIYAATREQLEAAEEYDRTAFDPRARNQEEQAEELQQQADQQAAGGLTPAAETDPAAIDPAAQPADQEMAAAEQPAEPIAEGETTEAIDPATLPADEEQTAQTTETVPADGQAATTETEQQMASDAASEQSGTTGFMSFGADQVRASTLMGQEIYGADNESIGEVSDLVLQQDGETRAALIDVGGFLGVGEKRIALPFDQIQVQQDGDQPRLTVAMTRQQLEDAPAFEDNTMGGDQAQQQAAPADQQQAADAEQQQSADTEQQQAGDANQQQAADADQQQAADADQQQEYQTATQEISADELMGSDVYGSDDTTIGQVGDVVFDPQGAIQAVVIDVGGFLGIGEKPVAVQFDTLNVQKNGNGDVRLMVNATQEQLENAPAYNVDAATSEQPAQ